MIWLYIATNRLIICSKNKYLATAKIIIFGLIIANDQKDRLKEQIPKHSLKLTLEVELNIGEVVLRHF